MRTLHSSTAVLQQPLPLDLDTIGDAIAAAIPERQNGAAAIAADHDPLSFEPAPAPRPEPTSPTRTWEVQLAAYRSTNTASVILQMVFPAEITVMFPGGLDIEQLDPEHWKIARGGDKQFGVYSGRKSIIKYSMRDAEPFGSTPAEAVEANGEILIYLPLTGRRSVTGKYQPTKAVVAARTAPIVAPATAPAVEPAPTPASLEARMRAVLLEARAIEALCPYQLIRGDGKLAWAAPVIE